MAAHTHHPKSATILNCAVVTVSDTRTRENDEGGALIRQRLESAGHRIAACEIIPDDTDRIRTLVDGLCTPSCDAVVATGGTGIAPRDHTYEAIAPLLHKRLDGFGELFRLLSFEEIGPAAMLSRALAGTCRTTLVFALPGAPAAVRLGLDRLILPVLVHAATLMKGR